MLQRFIPIGMNSVNKIMGGACMHDNTTVLHPVGITTANDWVRTLAFGNHQKYTHFDHDKNPKLFL